MGIMRMTTRPDNAILLLPSQIAIAVYRRSGTGDEASAADCMGVAVAPRGGSDDELLSRVDSRSPVAGLYVRAEKLFAAQVCFSYGQTTLFVAECTLHVLLRTGLCRILRERRSCR